MAGGKQFLDVIGLGGVLFLPIPGDPNGLVTAPQGSIATGTAGTWRNTDGATAWVNLGGGSTPVLVFRPGVPPNATNVFDDEDDFEAAALALQGPKFLQFDGTFAPCVITGLPGGKPYPGISTDAIWIADITGAPPPFQVTLEDGVVFPSSLPTVGGLGLNIVSNAATVRLYTGLPGSLTILGLRLGARFAAGPTSTLPPILLSAGSLASLYVTDTAALDADPASAGLIEIAGIMPFFLLQLGEGAEVTTRVFVSGVGTVISRRYLSNAVLFAAQALYGGTFVDEVLPLALLTKYDDLLTPPALGVDQVQAVLDIIKQAPDFFTFAGAGLYGVSTYVGMVWINRFSYPVLVTDVTLWAQITGTGGSTKIDVLVDSGGGYTSIFTVLPDLPFGANDDEVNNGTLIGSPVIPVGAKVRMDITQVQAGAPQNILAQVFFRRA